MYKIQRLEDLRKASKDFSLTLLIDKSRKFKENNGLNVSNYGQFIMHQV